MEKENRIFTVEHIYKAFDMGLDSGLYALEKSIELSHEDQEYLLDELKKMIKGGEPQKPLKSFDFLNRTPIILI